MHKLYGCSDCIQSVSTVQYTLQSCVHKPGQASIREPAASDLQVVSFLDPDLVNGKRVDFHLFDIAGSIGADVIIVDPTAPCPMLNVVWMRLVCLASAKVVSITSMC